MSYPPPPMPWGWGPPPPRPGSIPLAPLGVNDLLSGAIEVAKRNPRAVFGAGLIGGLLLGAATLLGGVYDFAAKRAAGPIPDNPTSAEVWGELRRSLVALLIQYPATLTGSAILSGLVAAVTMRDVLGVRTTLGDAWIRSRRFVLPIVGVALLSALLGTFGLLLLIVPGVIFYIRWSCAVPAMVVEQLGIRMAMRRSWSLVRGSTWRVLGLLLLSAVIFGAFTGFATFVGYVVAGLSAGGPEPYAVDASIPIAYYVITAMVIALICTFVAPIASVYTVLVYLDLRMRKEGLDAVLRAAHERALATGEPPPV